MRKKLNIKKRALQVVALVVTCSLVVSLASFLGVSASAAVSLGGIEDIKGDQELSILEIVPEAGTGSIGYYIAQQEPTAWLTKLGEMEGGATKRAEYAAKLLVDLGNVGLLGTGDYPLTKGADYAEYLPWNKPSSGSFSEVKLKSTESVTRTGKFEAATSGDYVVEHSFTFVGAGGTHVENPLYYVYGERGNGTEQTCYYQVMFIPVGKLTTENEAAALVGVPLYVEDSIVPGYSYKYAGTLGDGSGFAIEDTVNNGSGYYRAVVTPGVPTTTWDNGLEAVTVTAENLRDLADAGTVLYAYSAASGYTPVKLKADSAVGTYYKLKFDEVAVTAENLPDLVDAGTVLYAASDAGYKAVTLKADSAVGTYYKLRNNVCSYYAQKNPTTPYVQVAAGAGYFSGVDGYRFVGDGKGNHQFVEASSSAGGTSQIVVYDKIYVTNIYQNNEWFKRYVLDMDGESAATLAAMKVTVNSLPLSELEMRPNLVEDADLLVVSAGFKLEDGGQTIAYKRDVSQSLFDQLKDMRRVVDSRIVGSATTPITNLRALLDGTNIPGVTANNVYNFAGGPLATNEFHKVITTSTVVYNAGVKTAPYWVVAEEIWYENFLRGSTDLLSTDISIATCIRYVLNTHLTVNKKESIKVLDIQPLAKKYSGSESGLLTVNTVKSWLPSQTQQLIGNNITITHMSTAELIGKIDDITEEYDLIYIGAASKGNNLPDDFYYANIGAEEPVDGRLRGLLASGGETARYSGNDLTPKKQKELLEFATVARLPVVVSDKLVFVSAGRSESTLSVSLQASTTNGTLKAIPALSTPVSGVTYSYQWYRDGVPVPGGNSDTIKAPVNSDCYCAVTAIVDGRRYTAYSETQKFTATNLKFEMATGDWKNWQETLSAGLSKNPFTPTITPNNSARKLTVEYSDPSKKNETDSYQWYTGLSKTDATEVSGEIESTITASTVEEYYHCRITLTYKEGSYSWNQTTYTVVCYSPAYKLKGNNYKFTKTADARNKVIPAATVGELTINSARVDSSSLMYEFLDTALQQENVTVQTALQAAQTTDNKVLSKNQDTLVKYLNLSCPSIKFESGGRPKEYNGIDISDSVDEINAALNSYDCEGDLEYTFTIKNPTDPTPTLTTYTCNLYIDQNGDGRHEDDELVGINYIGEITENGRNPVDNGKLKADTKYRVERSNLNPYQFSGLVAWKLEIVKVKAAGDTSEEAAAHASEKGYAYIKPPADAAATPIKVLQIRSGDNQGTGTDLTDTSFTSYYQKLLAAKMYNITVTTTSAGEVKKVANKDTLFNGYNMLILGFADLYGELDNATAQAIVRYIDSGRAVLFTHDTTSYINNATEAEMDPKPYQYWGYEFNQVVRDKVGLDRYGVTNSTYKSDVAAGGTSGTNSQISETTATNLKRAGYTVAYVPGSDYVPAAATQGYTAMNIYCYNTRDEDATGEKHTKDISQVNQGSITQYPFKMVPDTTTGRIRISQTHHQYYQLNMNADDIVVWYCLSGNGTGSMNNSWEKAYNYEANHYNDVTNGYYIYNRGNITYSGAGHTTNLSDAEKQLFVNTMVAAYRAAYSAPTIEFKTAHDQTTTTMLVPAEHSGDSNSAQLLNVQVPIYFKIQDSNLTANKQMSLAMYYQVTSTTEGAVKAVDVLPSVTDTSIYVKAVDMGAIYRVDNEKQLTSTDLLNNDILYRTMLPAEVLNYFAAQNTAQLRVYMKVTTSIENSALPLVGSSYLDLKKLGLLRLE